MNAVPSKNKLSPVNLDNSAVLAKFVNLSFDGYSVLPSSMKIVESKDSGKNDEMYLLYTATYNMHRRVHKVGISTSLLYKIYVVYKCILCVIIYAKYSLYLCLLVVVAGRVFLPF